MMLPDDATLQFGDRAARALLGVDRLYRHEADAGDGLVVLNMDTAGTLAPESFGSYDDALGAFHELYEEAGGLPEPDRRLYYQQLCQSTLAFIRWRSGSLEFTGQLADFLHVPAEPVSPHDIELLCAAVHERLGALGYTGDLIDRSAAWEERNRVLPDEVEAVTASLLEEAWSRTEERLLKIPAPRSDGMRVVSVSGVPYNARCDYLARTIELNVDPILTRAGLKHLVVHEGCPGHYVQFKLRETMAAAGASPADVLLSVVNTASSSVFEGIADAGMEMLDWIDPDDEVQGLLNRQRAAIGTMAAWKLHAEGRPESEVTEWLRASALVGGEGWVTNRMRFVASPARAVLIWSYWWGERSVAPAWRAVPAGRRDAFLDFLYGRMHSPQSVGLFDA